MTALGAVFALAGWLGPNVSIALGLLAALVAMHVAGNALGTSLAAAAPRKQPALITAGRPVAPPIEDLPRLYERSRLSRIIPMLILAGGATGVTLGAVLLRQSTGASTSGIVFGSISFALLGALFGFLAGSFLEMTLRAWWQASRHAASDAQRRHSNQFLLPRLRTDVPAALIAEFDAG